MPKAVDAVLVKTAIGLLRASSILTEFKGLPIGGEHKRLDQRMQWLQRCSTRANLVGERREAEVDAVTGIALALPVQRLMLGELLEQDYGQQVRPGKAARRHLGRVPAAA